jgi:formylglycine-generating enzyme required for sulfatase activity
VVHRALTKEVAIRFASAEAMRKALQPAGARPGEVWVNPKDGAEMVWIPGGEFLMGSDPEEIDEIWRKFSWKEEWKSGAQRESPRHQVGVEGFWMARYEVTNEQFARFAQETGYQTEAEKAGSGWTWNQKEGNWGEMKGADWRHPFGPESNLEGKERHPVVQVSWNDAVAYCEWAGLGLPTEAQWEYAARGRNTGLNGKPRFIFVWGDDLPKGRGRYGNFADESAEKQFPNWFIFEGYDDGYVYTSPVGSFDPNGFGLYDMAGNVWEWCVDWFGENYYAECEKQGLVRNPTGLAGGSMRVLRGGSWNDLPYSSRVARRLCNDPRDRIDVAGFRVAMTPPQK